MAASTVSSSSITNIRANPVTRNRVGRASDCELVQIADTMEVATTSIDEVGDVILLFELKGNDRLTSLTLYNDDLDANGSPTLAINVGLYKNVNKAGTSATAVSAACYASANPSMNAAVTAGTQIIHLVRNIDKMGQTVAEDGGESEHSDPRYVGIAISAVSATPAAGTISWKADVIKA